METDKKTINECVDNWSKKVFGETFKYRPNQKETIVDIIYSWFNTHDNVLLDAPTGTGKSVIAISVAGVLSEYYNKKGYILISDLSLLQQYERDLEKYLPNWAIIKGQQEYKCIVNGFNYRMGQCFIENTNPFTNNNNKKSKKFEDCRPFCEYIVAREKAENSTVTVCTYSFWLIQRNMRNSVFKSRDFTICDEAHKLVDIVQHHFSPKITKDDEEKLKFLTEKFGFNIEEKEGESLLAKILNVRAELYKKTKKNILSDLINEYTDYLCVLSKYATKITQDDKLNKELAKEENKKINKDKTKTKDEKNLEKIKYSVRLLNNCHWIIDTAQAFSKYCDILAISGNEYMVKNYDPSTEKIIFNYLQESYLMQSKFHNKCCKRLYMSATIGDPETYKDNINASDMMPIKLPIVFDYSQSPIFFINEHKMSYKEKDMSFPYIAKMVENVLKLYPNKRGIIQTGSYSFGKKLYDFLPKTLSQRLLLYSNTSEKREQLFLYKNTDDMVLVGPSLVEGISLDDDLCRFQIIMKVPYPSLGDKFVSAKLHYNQQWYSNTTAISILQGVGRGIRNEKDWCVTFILDGCFENLLTKSRKMFPQEFIDRIQVIPSKSLEI